MEIDLEFSSHNFCSEEVHSESQRQFKMNHQARFINFVLVLVVFCDLIVAQNIGQNLATKYCTKIEFTQLSFVSEFRGCFNPKYDNFIIKDYNLNFKPLHPMAKQYLSNNRVNSCAALHRNLTFDQFTYIEAGIFLKSVRAEFIEIAVEDVEKKTSYPLQYYGVGRWEIFNKNIQKNITNAQVLCVFFLNNLFFLNIFSIFRSK